MKSCESQCGDIDIQYPFGIGPNCSMNDWFVIVCNGTANNRRAFISSINLEVVDFLYERSRLRVKSPVISINCTVHNSGRVVDLRRTPFTISNYNRFTVVGCKNRVLLTYADPDIVGCQPTCDKKLKPEGKNPPCSGNKCCQTAIPYYLQVFNPRFENVNVRKGKRGCKLAFIVENSWFKSNIKDPYKVQEREYVPMLVDWKINATALESLGINKKTTNWAFRYYNGFDFPYPNNSMLMCRKGYAGNPYLPDGCQDVDECLDLEVRSRCSGKCINTNGSYRCEAQKSWIIILVSSMGFAVLSLLFTSWWLSKFIKTRKSIQRKKKFFKRNGGLLLRQQVCSSEANVEKTKIFSSKELEKATDRFNVNRILGQGGQGTVYKGMLVDGRIVAVKKSEKVDQSRIQEFINEVVILSQINHRNVVKLLGCCLETDVPLLVYEFIPNGTLFHYLHHQNEEFQLSWKMRLQIAIEVAGALSYLHSAASIPIYHRDIKSTNILLDEKYRAKVSDFGTSRSIPIDHTHLTTRVQGTFGYLDPEYFQSNHFTEKSDVYSFGVVLVELLTGQEPLSSSSLRSGIGLVTHFIISVEEGKLFDILDLRIVDQCDREEVMVVASLAKRCLNLNGKQRPTMKEVTVELEGLKFPQKDHLSILRKSDEFESNLWDAFPFTTFSNSDSGTDLSI
ncbi:wall-associated receptor kinase-like 8 [Hevea brasiliensis]|uniref:wall-associated receptor kinase-like 8 n=1 Tax=Hevea brasiliensis TaxID=3981 RepID=UPI002600CDEA|nr:wall-associated receptor kinase-like 8 [Hevea brasiliensis]